MEALECPPLLALAVLFPDCGWANSQQPALKMWQSLDLSSRMSRVAPGGRHSMLSFPWP